MERDIQRNKKRRKRKKSSAAPLLIVFLMLLVIAAGAAVWVIRYAPTTEHGSLSSYYTQRQEDEACVVLNGEYLEPTDEEAVYGRFIDGNFYLEYSFIKEHLDDGYVYDKTEGVLRYATDSQIMTANVGDTTYDLDGVMMPTVGTILYPDGDTVYIQVDFLRNFTDFFYYVYTDPYRVVLETAGYEKTEATLRRNAAVRRFGGPKSLILEDGVQGEKVSILEDYGKWVCVLTDQGTIGCVMDRQLKDKTTQVTPSILESRTYSHKQLGSKVNLVWHQVTNQTANARLPELLDATSGVNVVSPTWFQLSDDYGNINNLTASDYIATCHARGIQVWALVSNIEVKVDEESVLNVTSHRDNLVNNLINACTSAGIDGINVDFEALSGSCKNGYIQFIRELSIACERADLFLSVDNYPPADHNLFYNRSVQADYADYVILMAYDEHNATTEPGSTASLPFVQEAVAATLEEVPADQLVMALPFYTRVWTSDANGTGCSAQAMKKTAEYLAEHGASANWDNGVAQNYAEFNDGDTKVMIWVEDVASLNEKMKVGQQNQLAGLAFWKLGLESPEVWPTIAQYVK
ncbi:MAG: glycosyl hydrolase family 18 [Lachnospiraceae bacterium]|nr:glycosyl hydrolase family 18 [Lachnospiraceae bacterium]